MRLCLLATLLLATVAAEAKPNRGPFKKIAVIRLREESGKAIDPSVKQSVLRRIEQIREWGADCVILDIESYGGRVDSSIETGDEIFALGRDIHTIAYVGRKAISGAALLSIACQEIVLSEAAQIGNSQAVYATQEGMKKAPEKAQTVVATTFRKYAEGNGYPVPLVEAMVREEAEVIRYRKRDPSGATSWVYFRADRPDGLPTRRQMEEQGLEQPPEVVVAEGEIAMLTPRQAVEYGIASRLASNLDELIGEIRGEGTQVAYFDWNWTERVSRFLLGWRAVLFLVGAGALYFALKVPGTGVPEALAVIAFGLFFGASAIAGFAGGLEVVLFFIGIVLIVVEIFLLPGFGVPGLAGLACVLVSIGLASIPETSGDLPAPAIDYLFPMAKDFLIGALGALALVMATARYLPSLPFFHRLRLAPAAPQTGSAVGRVPAGRDHPLIGARGVAETQLRPAGRALVDGERLDVKTEGGFVPAGTPVRVISVQGNVITVRPESAGR